jgi:hypothetical protein
MGKRKTEKDKNWILLSWTFRTCFSELILVRQDTPRPGEATLARERQENGYFTVFVDPVHPWLILHSGGVSLRQQPALLGPASLFSFSIRWRYRNDWTMVSVLLVLLAWMASHSQHLTSSSAGPSRKASVPARSLLGMTQASLLSLMLAAPLSLWLASVKVVPDPPTASSKRACLLAVCLCC